MRLFIALFFVCSGLVSQNLVLKNVNIIPVNHDITIKDCNVFIMNGVVVKITPYHTIKEPGKRAKKPESTAGYTVVNCEGRYLIPGLADMHVHFPGKDDPIKLQDFLKLNLAAGVTELRSMRGVKSELALRDSVNKNQKRNSPDIYVSYVIQEKDSVITKERADQIVAEAKNGGYNFIKYLGGMKRESFNLLIESCKANNLPIAGHAYKGSLEESVNAGFASVEHYQPMMKEFKKDATGFKKCLDSMKVKKIAFCPTLSFYTIYTFSITEEELQNRYGIAYVNAKTKNEWLKTYREDLASTKSQMKEEFESKYVQPSKENLEKFGPVLKSAVDAGVCVLLSPDECVFNVPGFSMYEEMKLYKAAGLTNYQILKCATLNAATCLKEQKNWGSIEIGKKANFVLLNSNPLENIDNIKDVEATIIHGRYQTQRELLEQLKASK